MGSTLRPAILTILAVSALFLPVSDTAAETWQQTLQGKFDLVDTFDELQDWGANGLYPSGAGDSRAYDPLLLPKKMDGSRSIWGYWNNKAPTAIVGPITNGAFVAGEVVANGKGTKLLFHKLHVMEGRTYLQMGWVTGSVGNFQVGDTLVGQSSGATATITGWPQIIANHGTHTWRGTGKSLLMNLGDNDNSATMAGIGAQRLGAFFGDGVTGKSGYKKIHVFMMIKFAANFFGVSGAQTDVDYLRVFKFFDLCSGFTSINRFGSVAEQPLIDPSNPQVRLEYGANASIFNINGGGLSWAGRAFLTENIGRARQTPDSNPPTYMGGTAASVNLLNNDSSYPASGLDVNKVSSTSAGGEWFGLEVMSDIGTMNNADGVTEVWVYDKLGNVRGHYLATGQLKLLQFDHHYNKITLGGNRRTGTGSEKLDGRFWVDDFIVNDSRIGPAYFQIPGAGSDPVPVEDNVTVDKVAPVASFSMPAAATSRTVPVNLSASDAVGVTGYRISESSVAPLASSAGWVTTRPVSFTFAGSGTRTAYAWARDAAGNVSATVSARVTITLPDTTLPVVTGFTMPAASKSLTVPITAFTASDNIGVRGYLVTQSSVRPLATATGWSATPPVNFTFTAFGARTAYAWVKDAAGNVSLSRSAAVIVDATAPVITSYSPVGGTYPMSAAIRIAGTATDGIALSHMRVSVDGAFRSTASGGSISYYWIPTSQGSHVFRVFAYDRAGNVAVETVYVTIR